MKKIYKQTKSVTECMLLAEANNEFHENLGKIFVEKVKQIRKRSNKK